MRFIYNDWRNVVTSATLTSLLKKQWAEQTVQNSQKAYREYNNWTVGLSANGHTMVTEQSGNRIFRIHNKMKIEQTANGKQNNQVYVKN